LIGRSLEDFGKGTASAVPMSAELKGGFSRCGLAEG
jgi:hypothetical protein